jgi:hypothetical protein
LKSMPFRTSGVSEFSSVVIGVYILLWGLL